MHSKVLARVAAVGEAFPPNFYDQETLLGALRTHWATRHFNLDRLAALHRNVLVGGRHLALPIDAYVKLRGFGDANDAWLRVALQVGETAVRRALEAADLVPTDVDLVSFVTVTGVATPSIEARLANRMGFRADVKRLPIFGLGCVAGAAGLARAADYLVGHPDEVAVLLSVELCSLTLQRDDLSVPNLIASGLFGDGAAAVVLGGRRRHLPGPRIVATRSVFYPDTERVMGWDVTDGGFQLVLSAGVPDVVRAHLRQDVDAFLADHGLARADIVTWVAHPGGPKVLMAMAEALEVGEDALAPAWKSLREVGNLSSTSVLLVLQDVMRHHRPTPGSWGMILAMGPGFCSELVLVRW
ncbi:MAG TPA: 3-oxoacyl-[acyl-carrier-protein] synthase III C-terminal domain-containing protein [Thermoanaerobaculaceae bacterium]|nr:3-oxoacyl-[acyl-carrier-protein] synthase III C-terminal domain-containing protein [Thermoanaerobaculaceae bacterium]HPS77280.1 3-oxoacyl-[acyl-carrier-protein] synthase III C-terminal domain-containing protein [Thermoanaerobaculaceae bacterium]